MTPPLPPRTSFQRLRDALANQGIRIVVLWVFLIVMFVAFYQFFHATSGQGDRAAAPEAPVSQGGMWVTILVQYIPLLALAAIVGLILWARQRFAATNKHGVDLMAQGDPAAAAEIFRNLSRKLLGPRTVAQVNLGFALLRLADLRGALDAFASVARGGKLARAYKPAASALIALCCALAGDLDAAERWTEEARRQSASATSNTRLHLVAEAIARCRRGDPAAAARLLDETWGEIERSTAADLMRGVRILRAFAAESASGAAAASVGDLLAGARPFRPGEYAWLGAGWPEMARYLEAKGFAAAAA